MSDLTTLEQLFSDVQGDRFFRVPAYQRTYSWEPEQREDLLHDLNDLLSQDGVNHFTGTIVAARTADKGDVFELVDGQQRLTSLVLLIARMLIRLDALGVDTLANGESVESLRERFVRVAKGPGNTRPRLELNTDTTDRLFQGVLVNSEVPSDHDPPNNKAETNLLDAARRFDRELTTKDQRGLEELLHVVKERLGFLFYAPRNHAEIGLMFEVINSRGKPLSELDKVKNFLVYYSSRHRMADLHDQVKNAWASILSDLNKVGLTTNAEELTFLQSCWVPFGDARARKSGPVYEGLKERFGKTDPDTGYTYLSEFVRLLEYSGNTFRRLYARSARQLHAKEEVWLERISFHPRQASILPLLVALFYRERDAGKRAATLELIEKLNFRYYVLGIANRSDSNQSALFQMAYDYFHGAPNVDGDEYTTEDLQEALKAFIREHADIRWVVKNLVLEADEAWDAYEWVGLKFFMASYEQELCRRRNHTTPLWRLLASRDPDVFNDFYQREHIVARNDSENIRDEVASVIKRRLGNFVLLREGANKSASDSEAAIKIREGYDAVDLGNPYQVEELGELLDEAERFVNEVQGWQKRAQGWREERLHRLLDQREQRLVEFALARWGLPEDRMRPKNIVVDWARDAPLQWLDDARSTT